MVKFAVKCFFSRTCFYWKLSIIFFKYGTTKSGKCPYILWSVIYAKTHLQAAVYLSLKSIHFCKELEKVARRCYVKKDFLENFAKVTEIHLCQSPFFKRKLLLSLCNFIKKETLTQVFSCEFCEIFKNICFVEHL